MKRHLFAILLAAAAALHAAGAALPLDTLPANAKWVVHLDVKALRASALGREILAAIPGSPAEAKLRAFEALTSIRLTNDVDAITFCGTGTAEQGGVLYLRGKWDQVRLSTIVAGADEYAAVPFGKHTLMSWLDKKGQPGARRQHACFVSSALALLSDREGNLQQALDAIDGKTPSLAAVPGFVKLAPPDNPCFLRIVAMDVKDIVAGNPQAALLQQAESLRFGAGADEQGVSLEAGVRTTTPETAQQVQQVLLGFQSLTLLQAAKKPEAAQIAQGARITANGQEVSATLQLPMDLVKQLLAKGSRPHPHLPGAAQPPPLPGKF